MAPVKHHFAQAMREFESGIVDRALWALAAAQAGGDAAHAKAVYLCLRSEALAREVLRRKADGVVETPAKTPPRLVAVHPITSSDVPRMQDDEVEP